MANPVSYRTLSELTKDLLDRAGFASQGSAAKHHSAQAQGFLKDSQRQLIDDFNDMLREDVYLDDKTVIGEVLYDLVEHCDPDRVHKVLIRESDTDHWCELKRGVPSYGRNNTSYNQQPYCYDIRYGTSNTAQIEFFPIPDKVYQFGYEFNRNAERFERDEDRTSIDSDLVFLFALANFLEFNGHSQAQSIAAQAQRKRANLQHRANQNVEITKGLIKHRRSRQDHVVVA